MLDLLCCIAAVGLHLGSGHFTNETGEQLNNMNPGGYVEFKGGLVVGGYHNSIRRNSYYAGYNHRFPSWGPVTPSVMGGVITGYYKTPTLALVPSLSLAVAGAELRLSYIPKVSLTKVHTLHLSIERRF